MIWWLLELEGQCSERINRHSNDQLQYHRKTIIPTAHSFWWNVTWDQICPLALTISSHKGQSTGMSEKNLWCRIQHTLTQFLLYETSRAKGDRETFKKDMLSKYNVKLYNSSKSIIYSELQWNRMARRGLRVLQVEETWRVLDIWWRIGSIQPSVLFPWQTHLQHDHRSKTHLFAQV